MEDNFYKFLSSFFVWVKYFKFQLEKDKTSKHNKFLSAWVGKWKWNFCSRVQSKIINWMVSELICVRKSLVLLPPGLYLLIVTLIIANYSRFWSEQPCKLPLLKIYGHFLIICFHYSDLIKVQIIVSNWAEGKSYFTSSQIYWKSIINHSKPLPSFSWQFFLLDHKFYSL